MVKASAVSKTVSKIARGPMSDYPFAMRIIAPIFLLLALTSGCSVLDRIVPERRASAATPEGLTEPAPVGEPLTAMQPVGQTGAATAAALDQTTAAEKKAAMAAPVAAGERALGKVAVSLGNPAEQGFWLRTTLVSAPGKGRVETAGGQSVAVDLLPGQSGAQLSLAAFRALGLTLTDLPEVTVFAN